MTANISERHAENLESLHDGKYYDRTNSKYKSKPDVTPSLFKKQEPKKCNICGKMYKGEYKDHKKWHKRWNAATEGKKKPAASKPESNHSILDQLKTVDAKLIDIMDGEKLKQLIINEIKENQ